jgi:hypothetical protein
MDHTLSSDSPEYSAAFQFPLKLAQRLVIYRGELYRVPAYSGLLRIKEGMAYVTQEGQDYVLATGQELYLARRVDVALVSSIGFEPVVLELFERRN